MFNLISWTFAIVGHIGVWCVAFNRTHATSLSRRYRKLGEKVIILMVLFPVLCVLWTWYNTRDFDFWGMGLYSTSRLLFGYGMGCLIISPYFVGGWLRRKRGLYRANFIRHHEHEKINLARHLNLRLTQGWLANALSWVPGNQATHLRIERFQLQFENLPANLEGLRVAHLSDLHLTGQIRLEYFQAIVQKVNDFKPDLIFITGDLVDEKKCLAWIQPIFGQLNAKFGTYYVLGNHDLRIKDQVDYRKRLSDAGIIPLGGTWKNVEIEGVSIALAGNELPWYSGAQEITLTPPQDSQFKILLSHSPDQMEWAAPYNFDWMLAGHTHGGQIQFPFLGPIVAPSKFGVKFASGAFDIGSMALYVSRGISGDESIRINCPPELGLFTLGQKE